MNGWDWALIVVVSTMSTAIAYLRNPRHKAFLLLLPVPFSLAVLSLGKPVDASNILGMFVLFGYALLVWVLHARRCWPIIAAIAVAVVLDAVVSCAMKPVVPGSDAVFVVAAVVTFAVGVILIWRLPDRAEPQHRTQLPPYVKIPVIALVVTGLIAAKSHFGGFMTVFPMVGLVAAYECRRSLWTIVRHIPWNMVTMTPALVVIRLMQERWGLLAGLGCGWIVLLLGLGVYQRVHKQTVEEEGNLV